MPGQLNTYSPGHFQETTTSSRPSSPENRGRFVIEAADFENAPELVKGMVRTEMYDLVHGLRTPVFERNAILLKAANINVHDTAHQDRDALIVNTLFDAFPDKLDQSMREPLLVASMVHDSQYIPAAAQFAREQLDTIRDGVAQLRMRDLRELKRRYAPLLAERAKWHAFLAQLEQLEHLSIEKTQTLWTDTPFPETLNKVALDPHAELGEQMMQDWFDEYQVFDSWTEEQQEIAAVSIRDHSNGSKYNPHAVPYEAQVLRAADKLDNTYHRVGDHMLNAHSLVDPARVHRHVPASILSQNVLIDRSVKRFRVTYTVDTHRVEQLMQRQVPDFTYSKQEFLRDFDEAYGRKSMPIAAEVVSKLMAEGSEIYSADMKFEVGFEFADSTEPVTKTYEPIPTSPNYN